MCDITQKITQESFKYQKNKQTKKAYVIIVVDVFGKTFTL